MLTTKERSTQELAKEWASQLTEEEEARLADFANSIMPWDDAVSSAFSLAERLVFAVYPDHCVSRSDADNFWVDIGFDGVPDRDTTECFIEAATGVTAHRLHLKARSKAFRMDAL